MDRKIPHVMGTQHPDNAGAPFFNTDNDPFISAYYENREAFFNFADLEVDEYMWDWEGKNADASVIDRLYSSGFEYFQKHPLGEDKFLTFRFPNIWEENDYSLMQAMVTMLYAEDFAQDLGFSSRPLFEAILPMTENADQLLEMQKRYAALAEFKSTTFSPQHSESRDLMMIPLFESFENQLNAPQILKEFISMHQETFHTDVPYMRVFLAGSDSALSDGFLNAIIGNKLALAGLGEFQEEAGIPIYPIAGMGSPMFRGGLAPEHIDRYLEEFPGLKTATVQSAFRYDNPAPKVKLAIGKLRYGLARSQFASIPHADRDILLSIARKASAHYHTVLDPLIHDLQPVFDAFPKRRDRHQHVGILGYSRQVDGFSMPRAINFTGSFYSIGIPPEFLGIGATLHDLTSTEMRVLQEYYPNIRDDFAVTARWVSKHALECLIRQNESWERVATDVLQTQSALAIELGPQTYNEQQHAELAADVVNITDKVTKTQLIERMGLLRHFLG